MLKKKKKKKKKKTEGAVHNNFFLSALEPELVILSPTIWSLDVLRQHGETTTGNQRVTAIQSELVKIPHWNRISALEHTQKQSLTYLDTFKQSC